MQRARQALAPRRIAGLYALTPDLADTDALTSAVAAAIDGGASMIQYRNKPAATELRLRQATALRALCVARAVTFIINDDVALARDVGADGVHLGRDDTNLARAREVLGDAPLIGASCYDSLERAEAAVAAGADYIAFGSFYPSATKPDAARAGLALLGAAKARWSIPVVAIGGINAGNARALIEAGADALAVIADVFLAPDRQAIEQRARAIAALFF